MTLGLPTSDNDGDCDGTLGQLKPPVDFPG